MITVTYTSDGEDRTLVSSCSCVIIGEIEVGCGRHLEEYFLSNKRMLSACGMLFLNRPMPS